MRKLVSALIILALATAGVVAYRKYFAPDLTPQVSTVRTTQGDILETVAATGTLEATRTVEIGTQVSGTVEKLFVDFNSIVKKGQTVALIEPSLIQAQLDSENANLTRADTTLQQGQDTLTNDQLILGREQALSAKNLVTTADLQTAELQVKQDEATVAQDKSAITVQKATVEQAQVNLDHCTITSPIDGIVISRNVDEGQTVASSLTTPTLFVLATDLTKIQLEAGVDEADVGKIHPGQDVTFTVDAYGLTPFHGTVQIVRLNPQTVSNVVTYSAVIQILNDDLRLKPGMTANLKVNIDDAKNVVRIPNAALRFKPSNDIFAALQETPPPALKAAHGATAAEFQTPISGPAVHMNAATTIDMLFAPMPKMISDGSVWIFDDNKQLKRVQVRTGLTDGTWTELVSGDLQAGAALVSNILLPTGEQTTTPGRTGNPLMPQRGGGPGRGR